MHFSIYKVNILKNLYNKHILKLHHLLFADYMYYHYRK